MTNSKNTNGNGYPFLSQKQIVSMLELTDFQVECLGILVQRQTGDELEEKVTRHTNKRGLRCSEATWMPLLAAKIRNADEVTDEEYGRLARTMPVYRKQLAQHFREEMIANDPTLKEKAAKFGI